MQYRIFEVPAGDSSVALEELNRFLRGHRVLTVDRISFCYPVNSQVAFRRSDFRAGTFMLPQEPLVPGGANCADDEFLEDRTDENRFRTILAFELPQHRHQPSIDFLNPPGSHSATEIVEDACDQTQRTVAMNERIDVTQISQCVRKPSPRGFQKNELMPSIPVQETQSNHHSQFKRHVESGWTANTAEIVNREPACLDDLDYPFKLPLPSFWEFESATRSETRSHRRSNERDKLGLVTGIVGDIQEDRIDSSTLGIHAPLLGRFPSVCRMQQLLNSIAALTLQAQHLPDLTGTGTLRRNPCCKQSFGLAGIYRADRRHGFKLSFGGMMARREAMDSKYPATVNW